MRSGQRLLRAGPTMGMTKQVSSTSLSTTAGDTAQPVAPSAMSKLSIPCRARPIRIRLVPSSQCAATRLAARDLTPRERLLAVFDIRSPLCPFIAAAVELHDPGHPARLKARDYKTAFAARLTAVAREAGAANPEQLGEQLALLLDGASARNRVLDADTFATAAAIATVLIDNAIPAAAEAHAEPASADAT